MNNYVLQYIGEGTPNTRQVKDRIHASKVQVVDDSLPGTILLSLTAREFENIKCLFEKDWSLTPEKIFRVPDTRKSAR
jgi:hypothetical protein